MGVLVLLNNFLHDLAVGILVANVAYLLILVRVLSEAQLGTPVIQRLNDYASKITWGTLAFILVGGGIRSATFEAYEWSDAAGRGQVTLLIIKHIVLGLVVFGGIALQIRTSRRVRKLADSAPSGQ